LKKRGILISMSGKGSCFDNSMVETFFKTLEAELVWRTVFQTRAEARASIASYDLSDIFGIELAAAIPPPETKTKAFASTSTKPSPPTKILPSKSASPSVWRRRRSVAKCRR
jgi:Integrase core domain